MNEDKAGVIVNAIGVAVLELIGERVPITRDNLVDKLEHNRRETGNLIGKRANRDAAELVRKGV
ncbi:hypothetical protein ACRARH_26135 [Phytobacter ursingii]